MLTPHIKMVSLSNPSKIGPCEAVIYVNDFFDTIREGQICPKRRENRASGGFGIFLKSPVSEFQTESVMSDFEI